LESKPELKSRFAPEALAHNTRNGKLFSLVPPVIRPMTVFYNASLYQPSRSFSQMTWEDVAAELGDNKIAFMTGENAWTTMLVWSSLVAVESGGAKLLSDGIANKIVNFNQPLIVNATARLQKLLQTNASANTIGAAYADAANAFLSKRAAVIANGSWMVSEFSPDKSGSWSNGFDGAEVHGDVLPGNVGLANLIGFGWWIPSSASPAEQELAKAFIEFMNTPEELEQYMLAEGGTAPRVPASPDFLTKRAENRLMNEYVGAVQADTIIAPAIGDAMPASIANNEFPRLLPLLINGQLSPEAFCEELTKRAAESAL
jgi:raffinose/stachyose/melibiose transport system substrate-binding protein